MAVRVRSPDMALFLVAVTVGLLAVSLPSTDVPQRQVWTVACPAGGSTTGVRLLPSIGGQPAATVYGPDGSRIGPVTNLSMAADRPGRHYRGVMPGTYRRNRSYTISVTVGWRTSNVSCSPVGRCPEGMVPVYDADGFCIFAHEAARRDATADATGSATTPVSRQGVVPWADINRSDAAAACRRAGYRLPTNREWQAATMAVPGLPSTQVHGNNDYGQAVENRSETCTIDPTTDAGRCLTGTGPRTWCTPEGVCDLNGNVKEWTRTDFAAADDCLDALPQQEVDGYVIRQATDGYVAAWNASAACPAALAEEGQAGFGGDHFWAPDGPGDGGIRRGGSYVKGWHAGPFNIGLNYPPAAEGYYMGFRCVTDG